MGSETIIASSILGGSSLLGGLMGGGGKGGGGSSGGNITLTPSPYEQQLAQMSQDYYNKTSPLRDTFITDFMGFLRPGGSSGGYYAPTTYSTGTTGGGTGSNAVSNIMAQLDYAMPSNWASQPAYGQPMIENVLGVDYDVLRQKYGEPPYPQWASGKPIGEYADYLSKIKNDVAFTQGLQNKYGTSQSANAVQPAAPSGFTASSMYNPYNLPAYQPLYQLARQGIESQYGPAREAIMASTPRGGALASSLANLEMGRAQQAGALPATLAAPIIEDMINKAYGAAFQSPQTSIAGMSGASSAFGNRYGSALGANSAANQLAAMQSASTASGLGSLAALGVAGMGNKNPGTGGFKTAASMGY